MRLKRVSELKNLKGKKVLLRLDLNVPVINGRLESTDLWKVRSSLATLDFLTDAGAKVIIVSHFGRPKGKQTKYSLKPIIKKLAQMAGYKIPLWTNSFSVVAKKVDKLGEGDVVALENIRFHKGETENSAKLAKQLASLADIFVNDAVGVINRQHASNYGVTKYLRSYAGLLLDYEFQNLYGLLKKAKKPVVAVLGGAKISTKLNLLRQLLDNVDYILLGGALANDVLEESDIEVGKSLVDKDAKLLKSEILDNRIRLPVDAKVAKSLTAKSRVTAIGKVKKDEMILDIGPETVELYSHIIEQCQTVIWNGPMGYFEDDRYGESTRQIAKAVAHSEAKEYVGGGETVKAVLQNRLEDKMFFVSTGGGGMLALLEGGDLKTLKTLKK